MNTQVLTPAESLIGMTLDGGWTVIQHVPKEPWQTGGNFSVGYIAESQAGEKGFLKALDFNRLIRPGADRAKLIADMTSAYVYERDLLRRCKEANLSRIIRSLAEGDAEVQGTSVPYIIFEIADGDLRKQANKLVRFDTAWSLRTMHHVATGVSQLHGRQIAHQDLKPSNVLLVKGEERKIGDLGRSATRDCTLDHVNFTIAGDRSHAPPEGLYGFVPPDWKDRRYGCDAYQLGSLLVFMLTGMPAPALLVDALDDQYRPENWGGTYQEVLPYLNDAFISTVKFVEPRIDKPVREELAEIIRQLCAPDVYQRGDPIKRGMGSNPFNMERYISKFNKLATVLERKLYARPLS